MSSLYTPYINLYTLYLYHSVSHELIQRERRGEGSPERRMSLESCWSFAGRRKIKGKVGVLAQIFKSEGKTSYPLFITHLHTTHNRYRPEMVAGTGLAAMVSGRDMQRQIRV